MHLFPREIGDDANEILKDVYILHIRARALYALPTEKYHAAFFTASRFGKYKRAACCRGWITYIDLSIDYIFSRLKLFVLSLFTLYILRELY